MCEQIKILSIDLLNIPRKIRGKQHEPKNVQGSIRRIRYDWYLTICRERHRGEFYHGRGDGGHGNPVHH